MIASAPVVERVTVTYSPPRRLLSRHASVEQPDLAATLGRTFGELYALIGAAGVEPDGPPCVVYYKETEPGVHWELDICAPIAAPMVPPAGFAYTEVPAERVITLLHVGPYNTLAAAYESVARYAAEHGLIFAGPPREFYLSEPDVPPAEVQTLVEWPISGQ